MEKENVIEVRGARHNNLKSVSADVPHGMITAITGLSGSGKSSLAFDTLYAEGNRRYAESLSSYTRLFMARIKKPACDSLEGLPPAVAIDQRPMNRGPRSTVGISCELYEYLRILYASIGRTISPVSGEVVKRQRVEVAVDWVLSFPAGSDFIISSPVVLPKGRTMEHQIRIYIKEGHMNLLVNEEVYAARDVLKWEELPDEGVEMIVDRLQVSGEERLEGRIADSVESGFFHGKSRCFIRVYAGGMHKRQFSRNLEADGITFEDPVNMMFSFNSPRGICPLCGGQGEVMGIDENLVVPNKNLSIYEGAVSCWKSSDTSKWLRSFVKATSKMDFPIHRPYFLLSDEERDLLWTGAEGVKGIYEFFHFVLRNINKVQYRLLITRFRGMTVCPECRGSRLKKESLYVKVGGKDIGELTAMSLTRLASFFDTLALSAKEEALAGKLVADIKERLRIMVEVGLGYLNLGRPSATLSGGENQRMKLATCLSGGLTGSLYVLDEPSIGLHARDTDMLLGVMRRLKSVGNTLVVVEHDEDIIRASDYLIDIGPDAGRFGGEIVYQGGMSDLKAGSESHTVRFLLGEDGIKVPRYRRKWNNYIEVVGARRNNLRGINVKFPLNVLTVVTGVSGSGKTTLVREVLFESLKRYLDTVARKGVEDFYVEGLEGDMFLVKGVEYIDQNSVSGNSRSNPAIYIGAYDEIRHLFAGLPLSSRLGLTASSFSFNKEGGRCEECKGEGHIIVEMQFLADLTVECDKCHGKRFEPKILAVTYNNAGISDVLAMTVDQAIEFFDPRNGILGKRVHKRLLPLQEAGLGYVTLGQSSASLSGGEHQRLKLASHMAQERHQPTVFIFDEPTVGLHPHDIKTLMRSLDSLIEKGHTVIVIEHNLEVAKCADHIIDLGPDGGDGGGFLMASGTPEEVAGCEASSTGSFLGRKLR
ncbi:MAG: excinuclease ABC subunit UvrA [Tannerellaceae bacterium]|jgi:excinuclease ABC subunit A|nr:excinuclease ABC subunit UvrA [Tannerellaceae bacterium]